MMQDYIIQIVKHPLYHSTSVKKTLTGDLSFVPLKFKCPFMACLNWLRGFEFDLRRT